MDRIAFVFSGQGAQHPGMAEAFYNTSPRAKELFDTADAIRPGTRDMCFSGTDADLRRTENTQPCLFLADLAAALALEEAGISADVCAGFSLGELPALTYAGVMDAMTGFTVTAKRGALMGDACTDETAMHAVLKLSNEAVEQICAAYPHVTPVNYNAPGQLVISGDKTELAAAAADIKAAGGRSVPLAVSGAFHSPYMNEPAKAFGAYLHTVTLTPPTIPVYANRTAAPYDGEIIGTLADQMNHPVLWEQTVRRMAEDGITVFIECGVGGTLQKLISKILPDAKIFGCETPEDIETIKEHLS
ncbi:MAG: ACP S-malonyltransferase [Ruminococcaceae bacterium]|nr:ACP S-malonyltransferase [Oscillospiraceae bacterium]